MNPPKLIGEVTEIAKWGKVVATRTFEQPDGKQDEFLVWGGKKGDQFVVPSIIFPVTDKEEVIAIRQFRYGANEFVLEIPGGCPDGKEGFEGIVRRELLEEAGYEVGELRKLGEPLWFEPAACWTKFQPILATGCKKVAEPKPDEHEHIEVVVLDPNHWFSMIHGGKVTDSKTIAVSFLAAGALGYRMAKPE